MYPDFEPFAINELTKNLGIYILNGILSSPQVKMKFSSHHEDSVNGCDLCNRVFHRRGKGPRRHKEFKCFLEPVDHLFLPFVLSMFDSPGRWTDHKDRLRDHFYV